jgi:hypothetical protein
MLLFRLPRHPLAVVAVTVILVLGVLDWLLVRSPPVPPAYVGSWVSGPTRLDIGSDGIVRYRTGDGVVSRSVGGKLTRLRTDTLSYRTLLIPTHLRINAPPHQRDDLWLMTVEGQELWKIP